MRIERTSHSERGVTLIEMLIALIVLAIGLLAVGRMFPQGERSAMQDRLLVGANYYSQEKLEELTGRTWNDPLLTVGRHPAGTATESLGMNGSWQRFYMVTAMAAPLDNLKKLDVTVTYSGAGLPPRSITATTYVRK